jgi:catechol 2,3-dioxygenase-like lactoylglutathione lyase family enzyme
MINVMSANATIPVADLDRAVRWYSEKFGFEPIQQSTTIGAKYSLGDGSGFILYPTPTNAGKAPNTLMAFQVDDVATAVRELIKRGVTFENYDMPGLKTVAGIASFGDSHGAWFKDIDGNIIGITDGVI